MLLEPALSLLLQAQRAFNSDLLQSCGVLSFSHHKPKTLLHFAADPEKTSAADRERSQTTLGENQERCWGSNIISKPKNN